MPKLLRAEVARLHQAIRLTVDPVAKRKLAERALELAQEAEAIADLPADVEALHASVAHYRHMLADAENINLNACAATSRGQARTDEQASATTETAPARRGLTAELFTRLFDQVAHASLP